jgi:hypothetical protein
MIVGVPKIVTSGLGSLTWVKFTLLVLAYSFLSAALILEGKQHEDVIHIMAKGLEELRLV